MYIVLVLHTVCKFLVAMFTAMERSNSEHTRGSSRHDVCDVEISMM